MRMRRRIVRKWHVETGRAEAKDSQHASTRTLSRRERQSGQEPGGWERRWLGLLRGALIHLISD
jgi:hypothetical protein